MKYILALITFTLVACAPQDKSSGNGCMDALNSFKTRQLAELEKGSSNFTRTLLVDFDSKNESDFEKALPIILDENPKSLTKSELDSKKAELLSEFKDSEDFCTKSKDSTTYLAYGDTEVSFDVKHRSLGKGLLQYEKTFKGEEIEIEGYDEPRNIPVHGSFYSKYTFSNVGDIYSQSSEFRVDLTSKEDPSFKMKSNYRLTSKMYFATTLPEVETINASVILSIPKDVKIPQKLSDAVKGKSPKDKIEVSVADLKELHKILENHYGMFFGEVSE